MTTRWVSSKKNMVVTFRTINKITFPVFVLGSDNWSTQDGLVYLDGLLLDDKNIVANTLGKRRLLTPFKNLYQLKRGVINHTGILKQARNSFIDSKGVLFTYEKTKYVQLLYRKIKEIKKKDNSSLLFIDKCRVPFTIPRPPEEEMLYAGVLYLYEQPWLLYEYSATKLKDTKRKI